MGFNFDKEQQEMTVAVCMVPSSHIEYIVLILLFNAHDSNMSACGAHACVSVCTNCCR